MTCETCVHFAAGAHGLAPTAGHCHRFPPTPMGQAFDWPRVLATDSCGEYREAPTCPEGQQ